MSLFTSHKSILSAVALLLVATSAQAEWSLGLQAGMTNFTTRLRGDSLYYYGDNTTNSLGYYQYPGDYNKTAALFGILGRYLHPVSCRFLIGAEAGYSYWGIDYSRLRADDNFPGASVSSAPGTDVDTFKTKSKGVVLLNAVLAMQLDNQLRFNIFAGPAWLNTQYIENDLIHGVSKSAGSSYQITADTGAEAEWSFCTNWSASMRFDYIYDTSYRTISKTGSNGLPLLFTDKAKSGASLYSFTLRYLFPSV